MKKVTTILAALFLIAFSANLMANNPQSTASADATATIITPIAISAENDGLAFGNIIASTTEGTVTVDFADARTQTGGATFPTVPGTIRSAEFKVTGLAEAAFSITLPSDGDVVLTGAGDDMELSGFAHNSDEELDGDGENIFKVGATLTVNASQAAGTYSGEFDVIVSYN